MEKDMFVCLRKEKMGEWTFFKTARRGVELFFFFKVFLFISMWQIRHGWPVHFWCTPIRDIWRQSCWASLEHLIYLKRKAFSKPVFKPGSCVFPESHWPLFQQKLWAHKSSRIFSTCLSLFQALLCRVDTVISLGATFPRQRQRHKSPLLERTFSALVTFSSIRVEGTRVWGHRNK